jgi:hypothetical protein
MKERHGENVTQEKATVRKEEEIVKTQLMKITM